MMEKQEQESFPTPQEIAAAIAAVRVMLRRRTSDAAPRGDRWTRTARAEGVAPMLIPGPARWATLERPR